MVTSDSHLSRAPPSLFPISIQKFQNSNHYQSSTLKITQLQPKRNVPLIQHELNINLHETQQLHGHFIKTCFNSSYKVPFSSLESYSSNAAFYSFLITSYIKNNCPKDAVKIYSYMRGTDTEVDNFIIPSVLKACCLIPSTLLGKEVHGFLVKKGFHGDVFVCNALVMMYSEVGSLASARLLFDKIENKDVVSWSTMIRNYDKSGFLDEALDLMRVMHVKGVKPSKIALISMIHVFAELADSKLGKALHGYVIRNGNCGKSGVPLSTALIDMYAKCTNLAYARRVFDGVSGASIISWTTMIAAYIHCNNLNEGQKLFVKMLGEGVFPNEITILSLVKECGTAGSLGLGKWLHAFTLRNGFTISLVLATAFVDMYGKCGDVTSARHVFDSIKNIDLMMWSAMISAYAQNNCIDEAFGIFVHMTGCGIRPNEITMVTLLVLCAKAGSLEMGKWIHSYIDKQGIKGDMILETSLVDMYAKCGDIDTAHSLFAAATNRDVSMWNAMISGFAMHGHGEAALELLEEMEALGFIPNDITFIGALHACSHSGLLQEGKSLFQKMVNDFGLVPKIEHYGCMVDLLGRAGLLNEAKELIENMPMRPNIAVLGSLLAACKLHKNIKLGEWVAKQFLSLEPHKCGYNVLMSNIYASANRWGDVAYIRRAMKDVGISKEPGVSSIQVNGIVHEFITGGREHSDTKKIYEMIDEMREKLEDAGYTPDISSVLLNIDNEEKETTLNYHSEKLAMAYGLISTAPGVPIRIVKNLRICDDCHNATKLLSKIYGREIIVRDRNRFHHFKEGSCSCYDYW
ncbi:pentatricopeptide repeat-containing protein At4g21065-like [Abrus precatorius]|uniref:Pentatricopeptide repeat-containing protein At4g21065-like n=1 Tax=Abrus precatorius TaxID=3816 RepID=A0A8B8K105_ABRPR|nr:pentatricopeptide repeat-containing protein At4g21065-like [Abrus precatorius]